MKKPDRRKYDRERKKEERRKNTPYAERQREEKRSEKAKARRRGLRQRPEQKAKEAAYAREYRKRPEVKIKERARMAANAALRAGSLIRPKNCQSCDCQDTPLRDGRTGLRMDHHEGYSRENWLNVRFICINCDGKQLRKNYNHD